MTHRLLLVEQSATMRYVLEKHAESLGYTVDACESYPQAAKSLGEQFQQFGAEYSGVLFGWPTTAQDDAARFALLLENSDHKDLPVVVMSADLRAETRAWVAGRDNTSVLAWKEYQGLEGLLQQLIEAELADSAGQDLFAAKFNNRDVHLLVVDDSATIRYSLRDLFQVHGYNVTLAATREEAIRLATDQKFDIAVLDYYLTETTGDVLCRELLASEHTGDIVCTVLTGTYSDHIIKRSLRAGAVECMFKNESSELLLSRIDAISRFVRQKRRLQCEQKLLADVLECIAGAIVLLNDEHRIVYINTLALEQLGISEKSTLMGEPGSSLLESGGPATPGSQVHAATWRLPDGRAVDVDYQHSHIDNSGHSLLRFAHRRVAISNSHSAALQRNGDPASVVKGTIDQLTLSPDTEPFLRQMLEYLEPGGQKSVPESGSANAVDMQSSLLILDVFVLGSDGKLLALSEENSLATQVRETLVSIHARENHVVAMGNNRFGFLMRHAEASQAYILTRKVMQRCLEITVNDDLPRLACTASLLNLTKNSAQPLDVLVQHALKGMDVVNSREPNQALLLDVRRLLSAYPAAPQ
ncbi:MAG: response regulator [Granulosicoccus sp.]